MITGRNYTVATIAAAFGLAALGLSAAARQAIKIDFADETVGAEPKSFLSVVGVWRIETEANKKVLSVDGRQWKEGQSAAGLAEKARALYGERYAEFLDRVQAYAYCLVQRQSTGVLTVSTSPDFAAKWLVHRLDRFAEAHPSIDLRVSATMHHVDFAREEIDLAVRHGDGHWAGGRRRRPIDSPRPGSAPPRIRAHATPAGRRRDLPHSAPRISSPACRCARPSASGRAPRAATLPRRTEA